MTVHDHAAWLSKNGYVVKHKDFYLFTAKFNLAVSGKDEGIVSCKAPQIREATSERVTDWVKLYQDAIQGAMIPKNSSGKDGSYQVNAATKPGREAFRKAVESGEIKLIDLVLKMKSYYEQNNGKYRVKVETYFEKEMWRDTGTAGKYSRSNDGTTITQPNL